MGACHSGPSSGHSRTLDLILAWERRCETDGLEQWGQQAKQQEKYSQLEQSQSTKCGRVAFAIWHGSTGEIDGNDKALTEFETIEGGTSTHKSEPTNNDWMIIINPCGVAPASNSLMIGPYADRHCEKRSAIYVTDPFIQKNFDPSYLLLTLPPVIREELVKVQVYAQKLMDVIGSKKVSDEVKEFANQIRWCSTCRSAHTDDDGDDNSQVSPAAVNLQIGIYSPTSVKSDSAHQGMRTSRLPHGPHNALSPPAGSHSRPSSRRGSHVGMSIQVNHLNPTGTYLSPHSRPQSRVGSRQGSRQGSPVRSREPSPSRSHSRRQSPSHNQYHLYPNGSPQSQLRSFPSHGDGRASPRLGPSHVGDGRLSPYPSNSPVLLSVPLTSRGRQSRQSSPAGSPAGSRRGSPVRTPRGPSRRNSPVRGGPQAHYHEGTFVISKWLCAPLVQSANVHARIETNEAGSFMHILNQSRHPVTFSADSIGRNISLLPCGEDYFPMRLAETDQDDPLKQQTIELHIKYSTD